MSKKFWAYSLIFLLWPSITWAALSAPFSAPTVFPEWGEIVSGSGTANNNTVTIYTVPAGKTLFIYQVELIDTGASTCSIQSGINAMIFGYLFSAGVIVSTPSVPFIVTTGDSFQIASTAAVNCSGFFIGVLQ